MKFYIKTKVMIERKMCACMCASMYVLFIALLVSYI